jgi:hypothetical protein
MPAINKYYKNGITLKSILVITAEETGTPGDYLYVETGYYEDGYSHRSDSEI